ncbi:MAG: UDP-N-acetylmuramate--L-alanine ligase [Spirochaetia bacterium]|nr:UDP-N-acetylmuramate--L-alanine ligase [Spirochaetia bacterium]
MGIGGSGMNGLAEVFINMGYRVSGSDIKVTENTERIKKIGGRVYLGHDAKNVKGADIVVYSNAVPETNPEIVQARKLKIPVIPRAVMLDEVMRLKYGIAIAGSHGKTTTTSMLATIFVEAKLDPTYIVGGVVKAGGIHARAGKGRYVIAEACEAFGSFLHLNPVIVGVTNIDNDHMDYYKKMDALKEAFVNFINKVPFYGVAYLNGDDPNVKSIKDEIFVKTVHYGFDRSNDIYAGGVHIKDFKQYFSVKYRGVDLGKFELNIPGRHNVQNSLMAIAIAYDTGIKPAVIKRGLKMFKNVKRRFNIYPMKNFTLVDDYAHHPMEVLKVLETGKEMAKGRVTVVFQPHLFSRTQGLYKEFARALSTADTVIVDKIYPAREAPIAGVTSALISDEMKELGCKDVHYEQDWASISERLRKSVKKGDMVFLMGAGNICDLRTEIEKWAK